MQAEKINPIPFEVKSLTQQIQEQKTKHQLMRKRQMDADSTLVSFQSELDQARDQADESFFLFTSNPTDENSESYASAKQEVVRLNAENEEAQDARRRLPKRIKDSEKLLHSLNRQKLEKINQKAIEVYGKKKDTAQNDALKALVRVCALTASTVAKDNLERFLSTGHVDTIALVQNIISNPAFREGVESEYKKLMAGLKVNEI